jgi:hypothetical protein
LILGRKKAYRGFTRMNADRKVTAQRVQVGKGVGSVVKEAPVGSFGRECGLRMTDAEIVAALSRER